MKKVLLSETLHITRNATRFLLLVLTLLHSTIREIRGEERNHIQQDETMYVTLIILGGFEGRRTRTDVDSGSLSPDEVKTLRKMINNAEFFALPETMTSSNQRCFDCYHYEITVTSQGKRRTVSIDTERAESPLTLQPLLNWLLKRSPAEGRRK